MNRAPGPQCKGDAGAFRPVIDRNRCEGKEDCVTACPYDVFEMDTLDRAMRRELSVVGRIKAWAHGNRQAFALHAERCHACGDCVAACPEKAIRLERI